jgi:hypothetical protein
MKKLLSFFLVIVIASFASVKAQNLDGVVQGLKSGNAATVAANSGDNVLLTIYDKSNTYSKAQSEQILRDFFSKIGVKAFDLKHKGDSPTGRYCIGTLTTNNGNFRVNVFMKNEGSKEIIKELRFQLIE